jgi:DNA-binding MarR family transcriptional regulator
MSRSPTPTAGHRSPRPVHDLTNAAVDATGTVLSLLRLAHLTMQAYDRMVRGVGLTASGVDVLQILARAGAPLTPAVIARRVFLTTGTMTSVLDTLERRGFVHRTRHPTDRRKVLVHLDADAAPLISEILDRYHHLERDLLAVLSHQEHKAFNRSLNRLVSAADDVIGSPAHAPLAAGGPDGSKADMHRGAERSAQV